MKFSEDEEKKIKSLPIVFRLAVDMLVGVVKNFLYQTEKHIYSESENKRQ